jgi:hypothetical protein
LIFLQKKCALRGNKLAIYIYRVGQKNLTIFKLQSNENYTIFLREFITKITFISKHFNYNIVFLNIVSVWWRHLLSAYSSQAEDF